MLNWLSSNLSTIVISIIRYLINQKKQGKSTCGCSGGCTGCSGGCHCGR